MKPTRFEYLRVESAAGAVAAMAEHGDGARILAGGQSLIPMMNFRLAQPTHLIDITRVADLNNVETSGNEVVIGAAVRQATVENDAAVARDCALLVEALELVAHEPIRHRGTVCGSLAHADPASELAATALALNAVFTIQGTSGVRKVSASDFFQGPYMTAIDSGEMLTHVAFPKVSPTTGTAILEFSRTHGNFAIAGAVAVVDLASDGTIAKAALSIFAATSSAKRATAAEEFLVGKMPTDENFRAAAELALSPDECSSDMHGSNEYRSQIGRVYVRRALVEAVAKAGGNK
jgi:carbon-monoxide dehydrogenase medium subunit